MRRPKDKKLKGWVFCAIGGAHPYVWIGELECENPPQYLNNITTPKKARALATWLIMFADWADTEARGK